MTAAERDELRHAIDACIYRRQGRRRRAAVKAGTYPLAHGTVNAAKLGCNCQACRDAINAYWRDRRAAA